MRGEERILITTIYAYDVSGRIGLMVLHAAARGQELLTAAFTYEGASAVLLRTTVSRPSEGAV